jgi:hypothetical protein
MIDPSLPLQGAIVAALKASNTIKALIGNPARVYDRVPENFVLPYVTVGEGIAIADKAECIDGVQVLPEIKCFSDKPGYPEVKQVAAAVIATLDENYSLSVTGHRLLAIDYEDVRYRRDADGLTSIADITFRILTEPT